MNVAQKGEKMVALTLLPDQMGSLVRDHHRLSVNPTAGVSAIESWGDTVAQRDIQAVDEEKARDALLHLTRELMEIDPDERFDYLRRANPALSEEHLGQIVRAAALWLDSAARNRMRSLVRQRFDRGDTPSDILADWMTIAEAQRLIDLVSDADIPDPTLAVCYAICEAHELAHAAFFIHEGRTRRKTDFTSINQTPEEVEADMRFASLR